jgi:hypothetical protein
MDHLELSKARKQEFRRQWGKDKSPNAPSREECLEAIHLGLSNDNHQQRDKKDLINIVDRWARANGSQLAQATRDELTTRFNAVHNVWKTAQYIRFVSSSNGFQDSARAFLEYARDNITLPPYRERFRSITEGIRSFDQWHKSYLTTYRGENWNELQRWNERYTRLDSIAQEFRQDLANLRNLNTLEQSFDDYDNIRLSIYQAGIDFFNITDKNSAIPILKFKENLEEYYSDFSKNRITTQEESKNANNLYKDACHALVEIVKTYGPGGTLDQTQSFQALQAANARINSFRDYIQSLPENPGRDRQNADRGTEPDVTRRRRMNPGEYEAFRREDSHERLRPESP